MFLDLDKSETGHLAPSSVKGTLFFREVFITQIYLHEDSQAQDDLPMYPALG